MDTSQEHSLSPTSIKARKVESLSSDEGTDKGNQLYSQLPSSELPPPTQPSEASTSTSNNQQPIDSGFVTDEAKNENETNTVKVSDSMKQISQLSLRVMQELNTTVQSTLNENNKTLEKDFDKTDEEDILEHGHSMYSIVDLGNTMYEKARLLSKAEEIAKENGGKRKLFEKLKVTTEESPEELLELRDEITTLKDEIEVYKQQLEMLRPDNDMILSLCNSVKIDPAIATVQHLLVLLKSAQEHTGVSVEEIHNLKEKLLHTTATLKDMNELSRELNGKVKAIELEDDKRFESKVGDICKYYEEKIAGIKGELERRQINLDEDFWVPTSCTLRDKLLEITKHKTDVAQEELRRDLSNAGTDKFSDDDDFTIPIGGPRHLKIAQTSEVYFEDDDTKNLSKRSLRSASKTQTKTCTLQ